MTQLKGGVLGFSNIGQNLTTYINQKRSDVARVVAACDVAQPQLDLAKETYGPAVTPAAAALMAMDLDFVLVVSSNHAHTDQVVMAAQAGKHRFCEKPITLSIDHFLDCIQHVRQAPNSLRQARHSLAVAPAMQESARTGKWSRLADDIKEIGE